MPARTDWTRDQLLLALRLYMRTLFGRLHGKNPEIIQLAAKIGRTPSALAMKASNFASIDPKLNRKGLGNVAQADKRIWAEFDGNPTKLAVEAEEAAERFNVGPDQQEMNIEIPTGATDKESLVKVRRIQSFRALRIEAHALFVKTHRLVQIERGILQLVGDRLKAFECLVEGDLGLSHCVRQSPPTRPRVRRACARGRARRS